MGQALYRKYRSRSLDEIVGQKPITTALNNALKSGQISHAYLFTGPRGIGKTSVARILAYAINGLDYTGDELPIDIIEIDAASNRRIDEIRDLREKVRIAPVSAKYKVYIIDEVHMLTKEAFNALLKTLEEPPAHVVFILATTEAHKLPETIISRTQRYSFKLVATDEIVEHLKNIANKEKIAIDDESLALIASHSGGSLRDAISLLDQVRHGDGSVTAKQIRQSFGLPSQKLVSSLLDAVTSDEPAKIIELLGQAKDEGASAVLVAGQLLNELRVGLVAVKDTALPISEALSLIRALLEVEISNQPYIQLELALISAQLNRQPNHPEHQVRLQKIEPPLTISEPAKRPTGHKQPTTPTETTATSQEVDQDDDLWTKLLLAVKKRQDSLYGVIRMAQPEFIDTEPRQLILSFQFPFHFKRANEFRHQQTIIEALDELGATGYKISCLLLSKTLPKTAKATIDHNAAVDTDSQVDNNPIDQVRNIFGNVEVIS